MNIFVLDRDPVIAARMQCDKHVVKMVLESTQMLCTAYDDAPYKHTHKNHPCSVWSRDNLFNHMWLLVHAYALADEYSRRYNKTHKCEEVLDWVEEGLTLRDEWFGDLLELDKEYIWEDAADLVLTAKAAMRSPYMAAPHESYWTDDHYKRLSAFPLAMPDEYKTDDPVESYRKFYAAEKAGFAKWDRGTDPPDWWTHKED